MDLDGARMLLWEPIQGLMEQLFLFVPKLLLAFLILFVGWLFAKLLVEPIIVKVLKILSIDKLADQIQLSTVLAKGGLRQKLSELIGAIFYWLIMLAVVMVAFNALNLTVAAELFQDIVAFLPNVIAAVFILIVGVFAAVFLSATVRTAASNAGILQAHLLGQMVQVVVVVFSFVAALQQLQIEFVGEAFLIVLAGLSFGAALAFGLGCKDLAGRWVQDLINQIKATK